MGVWGSRRQVRNHRHYWRAPHAGQLTYLALGDSAAQGVGVDDPADGYVSVVARHLAELTGRTVRIVNLSVSGATVETLRDQQIPLMRDHGTPDLTTCVIGGNDIAWRRRFRVGEFAAAFDEVAARLPERSVVGLVPSFGHWPYERRAQEANLAIARIARARGHAVADLYSPTRRLWPWRYASIMAGDLFHPNAAGHRLWAEAISAELDDRVLLKHR
ncbi:MAG TPA: SGNH/GDSL hydrolase family protein [Actinomycetales bacterium]|nr:SGNH/GDSL hydrolase family protein [Actinomycetales bacterium]